MKKFLYIIAAAALCMTACQVKMSEPETITPAKGTVTVPFTVSIPVSEAILTRADLGESIDMADKPVLENMYIAVFGESGGMLQQLVPATMVGGALEDAGYNYRVEYTAELPLYDEECHLHFIGNYNGDTSDLTFDYEKDFMDKLSVKITTQENDAYTEITSAPGAYWQKVILEDGIKATLVDGKFVLDNATKEKLDPIPLVRNYAKIVVTSASEDFVIQSYTLVNVPYQGTVAPYHNAEGVGFDNVYMTIGSYCDGTYNTMDESAVNYKNFVKELLATGYTGYMADNDLIFTGNPGEKTSLEPVFMYERTIPTKAGEQTGVIVKLKWKAELASTNPNYENRGKTYYYKLEILNSEGEYMPICRNVLYTINLTSLTGEGSSTFDGAFNGPFFGNVSSSLETATLTDINNNISRIVVNRMDYTSVNGGDEVDIYFQFYTDMNGAASTDTSNYKADEIMDVSPYGQAIDSVSDIEKVTYEGETYMHVKVTLNEKDESATLRGKLRVQGILDSGVGSLYRDIVFTVMQIQDFTSESKVVSSGENGKNVTVTIGLPEGLPYSIFPLQVKIEAQNNNLTTTSADLPVGYGVSAFNASKNSFYFIKTIQYKDYVDTSTGNYVYTTSFDCEFTNTDTDQDLVVSLDEMGGYFHQKNL